MVCAKAPSLGTFGTFNHCVQGIRYLTVLSVVSWWSEIFQRHLTSSQALLFSSLRSHLLKINVITRKGNLYCNSYYSLKAN